MREEAPRRAVGHALPAQRDMEQGELGLADSNGLEEVRITPGREEG